MSVVAQMTQKICFLPKNMLVLYKRRGRSNESLALEKLNGSMQNRDDYTYTCKVLASIKVQGILNSHHLTWGDKENPEKKKKNQWLLTTFAEETYIAMLSLSFYIPIPMCLLKTY